VGRKKETRKERSDPSNIQKKGKKKKTGSGCREKRKEGGGELLIIGPGPSRERKKFNPRNQEEKEGEKQTK